MTLQDVNSLLLISILFLTCICAPASSQLMSSRHDEEDACKTVDCGMGKCQVKPDVVPGYVCVCDSGWTKPQLLGLTWPSCVIPNCTFNYQCGGEPPLPPLPPLPLPPLSLACFLVFCGDGNCVASADGHECQCHQGSANMLGLPALPCVQKCNLGAECDVGFGPPATPSPPSPPVKSSASPGNGKSSPPSPSAPPRNDAPSCSWNYRALSWMLLAAIVVSWI